MNWTERNRGRLGLALAIALTGTTAAFGAAHVNAVSKDAEIYRGFLEKRLTPASESTGAVRAAMERLDAADRAADAAWLKLKSRDAYEAHRRRIQADFIAAMGGLDLPRTPLRAKVTGRVPCPGYRVEKILFESRPGVYVTALLFLPDETKFKPPYRAILLCCGHALTGKNDPGYQRGGVLGALAGFAVFEFDPISQGEREQVPGGFCCEPHNRYGALAELLGHSTARQRIWDGIRAIDYLMTRDDIRHDGVGCMGNSGGGTETALLEAVEPRILAACPSCYITSLRHVCRACGPQDAEQNTFGQLRFGLNHAGYVLAGGNAVRIHCNFRDAFPYPGSCATIATVTNTAAACGLDVSRYGMTDLEGPHGWREASRLSSVQWMRRWLAGDATTPAIDVPALRLHDRAFLKAGGLKAVDVGPRGKAGWVTPANSVAKLPGFKSIYAYLRDDLRAAEKARPGTRTDAELAAIAARRAGIRPVNACGFSFEVKDTTSLPNGVQVIREVLIRPGYAPVPAVTFLPKGKAKGALLVTDDRHRAIHPYRVAEALAAGKAITVADLSGTGETGRCKHRFYNAKNGDEEAAVLHYLLGESLVGVRAEEIVSLAASLKGRSHCNVELVPHGRTCIPAAHARAVASDLISGVTCLIKPLSWREAVETSAVIPFADVVHGALLDYDWTDLLR